MSQNNSIQENEIEYSLPETSEITITQTEIQEEGKDDSSKPILLKDSKNPLSFFTKIGICSFINFGVYCLICLMILYDPQQTRQYYWIYKLEQMFWVNIMINFILKCIMSFIGGNLKGLGLPLFLFDNYFSLKIILGMYFYFGNYLQNMYIYNAHYVILFCYILFANSLAYIFSTLSRDKKNIFNTGFCFICMECSTIAVLVIFKSHYEILTMGMSKYYMVFFFFSAVNFYISLNSYFMLINRGEYYYENEYIYGYYAMWTDWFSFFWRDIFKSGNKEKKVEEEEELSEAESDDRISQSFNN